MHPHAVAFAASLVVPQVAFLAYTGDAEIVAETWKYLATGLLTPLTQVSWWAWLCLVAFSLERLTYMYVWNYPHVWMKFCSRLPKSFGKPCAILGNTLPCNKVIQASSVLLANYMSPMGLPRRVTGEGGDLNEYAIFMGIQMFIIGQFLNWAVYATIGKKGVYYGCRLGEKVPWVEGPPFTMVVHPQYVGAILSLFGLGLVTITPWHADHGLWLMMFMQYGLYVATMYVEDKL
jgi:methylene-fatty-acyl-phospholipid synthase